ncbi:carbonic anhydrase [Lentinula edodes]|uniref:Carbonic anhydrase n=1 Tax=Lentinula lateritia TaxID=40482 RepID=A0A9W9DF51_9AGAR|nr:carbonic anhydrase [Lentinula edodes]
MPLRHLAYSLYACNSNMLTGAGVVRHCSSSASVENSKVGSKPLIALPPIKKLAIVTCMDARINPFTQLGIKMGEAHIIRNAGGMARDALRSLIISQRLLGTREIAVYHHTGCGMATFSKPYLKSLITEDLKEGAEETVGSVIDEMDFLEWPDVSSKFSSATLVSSSSEAAGNMFSAKGGTKPIEEQEDPLLASLKSEVHFLRTHPLIIRGTKVSGWVWDVGNEQATRIV